jgi:hypothetical protein
VRLDSADAAWKEGAMLDGATVPDEIDRDELDARLDDPSLVVLDVLPPASFAAQHIRGARNLPLADVATRAPLVLPDRDAEIAVYRPVGAVPDPRGVAGGPGDGAPSWPTCAAASRPPAARRPRS